MARLKDTHPEQYAKVRVLWQSPLIASDPLVWRKDLPQDTKDKLRNFFVNYAKTDPKEKEVMKNLMSYSGFVASSDAQLLPVRQVALFQQKQKVEADAHLSDTDRKTQVAAIDAKLNALNSASDKQ
jgi:phosphonate transport system substrate-binding protein